MWETHQTGTKDRLSERVVLIVNKDEDEDDEERSLSKTNDETCEIVGNNPSSELFCCCHEQRCGKVVAQTHVVHHRGACDGRPFV